MWLGSMGQICKHKFGTGVVKNFKFGTHIDLGMSHLATTGTHSFRLSREGMSFPFNYVCSLPDVIRIILVATSMKNPGYDAVEEVITSSNHSGLYLMLICCYQLSTHHYLCTSLS